MDNFAPFAGLWWKFEEYEIRDRAIRPRPGSRLQRFGPWEDFNCARSGGQNLMEGKKMMAPPYRELFDLIERDHHLAAGVLIQRNLIPNTYKESILRWCKRYGLLGLLPHRAHSIVLPARWDRTDALDHWWEFHGLTPEQVTPMVNSYLRTSNGWLRLDQAHLPARLKVRTPECGSLVSRKFLPGECPRACVIWAKDLDTGELSVEPIDVLAPFFPEVTSKCDYPLPLSDKFWALYAEPVYEFLNAALLLHRSVKVLTEMRGRKWLDMSEGEKLAMDRAQRSLNAMAAGVNLVAEIADTVTPKQVWAGSSLLSSLAAMALLDVTGGYTRRCANCGRVFVSTSWQGNYCRPTCRNTFLKSKLRKKQKKARELRAAGLPLRHIARQLETTLDTLKGWIEK